MSATVKTLLKILGLSPLMTLLGCVAPKQIDLAELTAGTSLQAATLRTSQHLIQSVQPQQVQGEHLRVYIEGDGRAWISRRSVSLDPTPLSSFMPELALSDPKPSVYMARVCQYHLSAQCQQRLWTNQRFSQEAVSALSEALDQLKARFTLTSFELVGYSGGGTMALLLAAQRSDVRQVQTIAGNLDSDTWTLIKQLSPLSGSLNPVNYAQQLRAITQRHFLGLHDQVVPATVAQAYAKAVQPQCVEWISVEATHHAGFAQRWRELADTPISCTAAPSP